MSKAFTRESDDAPDLPLLRPPSSLPHGAKNYITPGGVRQLRESLNHLLQTERPSVAAMTDLAEQKRQLQILNQQIVQFEQSLGTAEIVPPPAKPWEQVRFGATVTVRERSGVELNYRIVGVDETDLDRDWVSWCSPLAKALLNAQLSQRVRFRTPSGEQELEITAINYE
ncbi:MAG: transcription elongation factor GreB [Pedosphaera sp.]|nr:transcription elongation factor GreB [Pedosphaera sp.]